MRLTNCVIACRGNRVRAGGGLEFGHGVARPEKAVQSCGRLRGNECVWK